nr:hypothetical protein [Tanacetum cinerariifolium]
MITLITTFTTDIRCITTSWQQSCFLRYIDTRPNGDALRKCILEGPYIPSTVIILDVPATDDSLEVQEQTTVETLLNMSPKNKEHYKSEKEEYGRFTSQDGETMKSYYSRFYKMMNEMYDARYNVFANERQHSEQPESVNNTCVVEKVDSNVIPGSPDMCDNDIQTD